MTIIKFTNKIIYALRRPKEDLIKFTMKELLYANSIDQLNQETVSAKQSLTLVSADSLGNARITTVSVKKRSPKTV